MNKTLDLSLCLTVATGGKVLGTIKEESQVMLDMKSIGKLGWAILMLAVEICRGATITFIEPAPSRRGRS